MASGITGALIGIKKGLHLFGEATRSFPTATGGGIARDVLVNEVPLALHGEFYGSVALLLAVSIYALHAAGWMNPVTLTLIFVGGLLLRRIAHRHGWTMPKVS